MRDLPDGCVRVWTSPDGAFCRTYPGMIVTHVATPTPAFHALLDKAGRVEGLEAEVAALKGVLVEVRAELLAQIADRKQQLASLSHARPGAFDALVFNDKEIGRAKAALARIDTLLGGK